MFMKNIKYLIVPSLLVLLLLVVHFSIFISHKFPIVTQYFTIDNTYWMDGPFIYGQYTISPYTNKVWWGYFGGTNRSWGIYTHKAWPIITIDWSKSTVDKDGVWHKSI